MLRFLCRNYPFRIDTGGLRQQTHWISPLRDLRDLTVRPRTFESCALLIKFRTPEMNQLLLCKSAESRESKLQNLDQDQWSRHPKSYARINFRPRLPLGY
jgi:hypothetical protein